MPNFLFSRGGRVRPSYASLLSSPRKTQQPSKSLLIGKTVSFVHENEQLAGLVSSQIGDSVIIRLAVPDENGLLAVSNTTVERKLHEVTCKELLHEDRRVSIWEAQHQLETNEIKAVTVRASGSDNMVIDYKDVMFSGYASTFSHITESDRQGDRVMPGAFKETIVEFKRNPVMLMDHRNSVENIVGRFSDIREDDKGLVVTGVLSNAPALAKLRFLLVEGSLRTLSMGGLFLYGPDGRTIEKVHLFEISLVAVPANPDAIISVRALDLDSSKKMFARHKGHKGLL